MNPILIILLFVIASILWLLCSFLFKPVGKVFKKLLDDAKESMLTEEKENKEE